MKEKGKKNPFFEHIKRNEFCKSPKTRVCEDAIERMAAVVRGESSSSQMGGRGSAGSWRLPSYQGAIAASLQRDRPAWRSIRIKTTSGYFTHGIKLYTPNVQTAARSTSRSFIPSVSGHELQGFMIPRMNGGGGARGGFNSLCREKFSISFFRRAG